MSDLISRSALIEFARNHFGGEIDCNDIARLPVVDAVPVVRCKDCVNSYHNGREGTRTCRKFRRVVGVNSYCSCGIAAEELEGTECD